MSRELLTAAAKAAGYEITWKEGFCKGGPFEAAFIGDRPWNPLADDGDVQRLAVKLEIAINPFAGKTVVAHTESGRLGHEKWECWDDDSYTATRRAIVCLAAEIGKSL